MAALAITLGYCLIGALVGGAVTYRLNLHRQPRWPKDRYSSSLPPDLRAGALTAAVGAGLLWPLAIFFLLAMTFAYGLEWWATSKERKGAIARAVDKALGEAQAQRDRRIAALEHELGLREEIHP